MLRPFRSICPTVDPSAFVDASAQVIGDVRIGPENYVRNRLDVRDSDSAIGDQGAATAALASESRIPDPGSRS